MRVVIDTSVLVSAMLNAQSVPGRALVLAASPPHVMLYSSATVTELLDVVERPKLDRFLRVERRRSFVATYLAEAEPVVVEAATSSRSTPGVASTSLRRVSL